MAQKRFGFTFSSNSVSNQNEKVRSPVSPEQDESAINVAGLDAFGTPYGWSFDLDNTSQSENALIDKYREISLISEVDYAIEEIISDAIITDEQDAPISIDLEQLEVPASIKNKISESFDYILNLLRIQTKGHDIFKRWYIDGRISYHIMIDEENPSDGIQELRYIDPKKIKKVREVKKTKTDSHSIILDNSDIIEYYVYNEKGVDINDGGQFTAGNIQIAKEAISHSNSGIFDQTNNLILSHLHKALRPSNNVRMMEDSIIIYRLSRAPERRIFYIDVGNLPKGRAEQYMRQIMTKYKNKLVYDANTGEVADDRRHLAMTEDYWIPRREGSRGTEISTIPGGQNLGQIEDVDYFRMKLYRALNIPMSRFEQTGAMFSRGTEITRDELKFSRFISRLRSRFNTLLYDLLGKQLVLSGVMSWSEWEVVKTFVYFDYLEDNFFSESFESEVLNGRLSILQTIEPYVGSFFSKEWIRKNVLKMSEEEMIEIDKQIEQEEKGEEIIVSPIGGGGEMGMEEPPPEQEPAEPKEPEVNVIGQEDLAESMSHLFKAIAEKDRPHFHDRVLDSLSEDLMNDESNNFEIERISRDIMKDMDNELLQDINKEISDNHE